MTDSRVPVDFAGIMADVNGIGVIPAAASDYNGFHVDVDLAKPVDYIDDIAKIIVTIPDDDDHAHFNLRDTLIYRMWVIQGKPTAATDPTQDQINRLVDWARMDVARAGIYSLCHACNHTVTFRNSDVTHILTVPTAARQGRLVDAIVRYVKEDPSQELALAAAGRNCLLCIEANAIHREQLDGHNWYTRDTMLVRTPTGKACTIAGADTVEFREFMRDRGHDNFHHLSSDSLDFIARHVAGAGDAVVTANDFPYANRIVTHERLSDILYTGEAAVSRYPAGILGKAAVIVGCHMTTAMIQSISTVARLTGASGISRIVEAVRAKVSDSALTHEALLDISRLMEPVMALTFGYCTGARLMDEDDYVAFKNHASRAPGGVASGRSVATAVMNATPHAEAVTGAITTALSTIGDVYFSIARLEVNEGGNVTHLLPRIHTSPYDPNVLSAEVGVDANGQLMEALLAGRVGAMGGGGGGGNAPPPAPAAAAPPGPAAAPAGASAAEGGIDNAS